jgi:hypothetical protein
MVFQHSGPNWSFLRNSNFQGLNNQIMDFLLPSLPGFSPLGPEPPLDSRNLPFPKVNPGEEPPPRGERHNPRSVTTVRVLIPDEYLGCTGLWSLFQRLEAYAEEVFDSCVWADLH